MASPLSEARDSQDPSHPNQPRSQPPDLDTVMSTPYWPLGPAFYRLRRALHRSIPCGSSAPDPAENAPTVSEADQTGRSHDAPQAGSQVASASLTTNTQARPVLGSSEETPTSPFTPDLTGSFGQASLNDSPSEPRSWHAAPSPHSPINVKQPRDQQPHARSPSEPSRDSIACDEVGPKESPHAYDSYSDDESLDGTPIMEDNKLTHMKADPPTHSSPAYQAVLPSTQQVENNSEDSLDPDLDGLPIIEEMAEIDFNKKRPSNADELPVLDSKRRKTISTDELIDHTRLVSNAKYAEDQIENNVMKSIDHVDNVDAFLESCIPPPPPTLCQADINIPQLLEAIRDVKASSSRLRSEGFIGDETELRAPKPFRKSKPSLQFVHKDRLAQCVMWPKGDQLDAPASAPPSNENAHNLRAKQVPVPPMADDRDPFPLDGYIISVMKKIVTQFWNQYIVEAFCRVGLWLEKQGVWEHGNWGTLLSNELARFIDIGGKGRLADMLAYHRPKPFEEILLLSSQMHFLEVTRDQGLMRVRLNKDFTPRGLFYRPLIRGLRLWTYNERTPIADRNRLEVEYASRFADSGCVSELLPPKTSFRKYTHWAANEGVIVMIPKEKVKGGAKDVKLTPSWVSREYKKEPAPDYKLDPNLLKSIENLIAKSCRQRASSIHSHHSHKSKTWSQN